MKKTLFSAFLAVFFCIGFPAATLTQDLKFLDALSLTAGFFGDLPTKPSVAYNSNKDQYLVVYDYSHFLLAPKTQIHGALLSSKGDYIKNVIISDKPYSCVNPQAEYDPVNDIYLITWLYDHNDDESDWDLFGRFMTADGTLLESASFFINQDPRWSSYSQRMTFNSDKNCFVVVHNSIDTNPSPMKPRILGYNVRNLDIDRVEMLFDIQDTRYLVNPDVAYNPHDKEIILCYSDLSHVYVRKMTNLASFPSAEKNITNLSPPLAGVHDYPKVSYLQDHGAYLVVWNTDKNSGSGKIYSGLFGAADFAGSTVYTVKIDDDHSNVRPDFYPDIDCQAAGDDCLTTWMTVHNSTYYTYGRILRFGNVPLLQPAFPFDYLGPTNGWGSSTPRVSIGSGQYNFMLGYGGIASDNIMRMYARPSFYMSATPFPWVIFMHLFKK